MLAANFIGSRLTLNRLDGWADQPKENLRLVGEYPNWETTAVQEWPQAADLDLWKGAGIHPPQAGKA